MMVQGGFAGAAVHVKPIVLEEETVAARLVGPVGGTEGHDGAAEVVAVACAEAAGRDVVSGAPLPGRQTGLSYRWLAQGRQLEAFRMGAIRTLSLLRSSRSR